MGGTKSNTFLNISYKQSENICYTDHSKMFDFNYLFEANHHIHVFRNHLYSQKLNI